jgi:hypothetical protein
MHDDEKDDPFNRTDCVPSLFTVCDPFDKCDATGIIENELCRFEVDTVLRLVDFVFCLLPFDSLPYLQYGPYETVKPDGRAGR